MLVFRDASAVLGLNHHLQHWQPQQLPFVSGCIESELQCLCRMGPSQLQTGMLFPQRTQLSTVPGFAALDPQEPLAIGAEVQQSEEGITLGRGGSEQLKVASLLVRLQKSSCWFPGSKTASLETVWASHRKLCWRL